MAADFSALDHVGLNLHAVFDLQGLPSAMRARLLAGAGDEADHRQLIMIGNAGRRLWAAVEAARLDSADPIDDFSVGSVEQWFADRFPENRCRILYPGRAGIDLQSLGRLAGWHHPSPLLLGILPPWGTWYAYRVVLLADTALPASTPLRSEPPCERCSGRPCISNCPAGAMDSGSLALDACVAFRRAPGSPCAATCLAREHCPVGAEHRYCEAQMRHSYSRSLAEIERYAKLGAQR